MTQWLWIVCGLLFVIVCAMQLATQAYFAGKFFPGTTVAGMNLSGLTRAEARDMLSQQTENYQIKLQVGQRSYNLKPSDLGVVYDVNTTLSDAYLQGRENWYAPVGLTQTGTGQAARYSYSMSQEKQRKLVETIVTESGKAPVDASIVIDNGNPSVKPEESGLSLAKDEVSSALDEHISTLRSQTISLEPTVQQARIKSQHLSPAVEQTKQLLTIPVTITYEGQVFRPTPAQMGGWISYEKSTADQQPGLSPKINLDGVKNYLQSVATKINQNPVNRKIKVENGQSSEERAGKEGIQLDQEALATSIGQSLASKQAYTGEAPVKKVPFQTEYNRVMTLDYGRYIEINLSRQRLWVYQDKKVIYESPITSGAAGAGYPTVTGLFSIQAKQTNRNLNGYAIGYDYNVFVKYWMPFSGNYGLHDASWRSAFGGQDYYYGGSHGCVNLPNATAAFIFGWASVGTPVWVHK